MKQKNILILSIALLLIYSCNNNSAPTAITNNYSNGVFVVEQGAYQTGSGTLSFINKNSNTITNDVFYKKNNFAIGNVLQSMNIINNIGYLVVNNSNKIIVFNPSDMLYTKTISGTTLPRYITKINSSKAYVTEWGDSITDGAVRVLDLTTNTFTKRIKVGNGAEKIIVYGDRAFVTCNGGLGNSDSIAVVDIFMDTLIGKISAPANPSGMVQDAENNIWILCAGQWNSTWSALAKNGKLMRYNTFTNKIDKTFIFSSAYSQPNALCINGAKNILYYAYNGGLWSFKTTATALPTTPIAYGNFYGIGIDPNLDIIYTADAKDYNSNGICRRFNTNGLLLDSFNVGIFPSEFYFNN